MENPDTGAWLGFAFGDYDGDGKLDLMIVEPPYLGGPQKNDPTRNLLYKGMGNGAFDTSVTRQGSNSDEILVNALFGSITTMTGSSICS